MSVELWASLPGSFVTSRNHLHQIAFFAISPARFDEVGRMGLSPTDAGFGTPEFNGKVARVEGDLLVLENDGNIATQSISDVRSAAEFFTDGYREVWFDDFHDPLTPFDPDTMLSVDEGDTALIGAWFSFGFSVLNKLRRSGDGDDDISAAQIWPEHFDAAAELGPADAGRRASYGASPGDAGVAEPYLYVAPWGEFDKGDPYWNASSFGGSILTHGELRRSDDPESEAYDFLRTGYERLRS
ncbi:MAG TPA: hypothetical protein VIW94_04595 [Acidimicrobiia bacterium]